MSVPYSHLKKINVDEILNKAKNKKTIVLEHNGQQYRIKVNTSRFNLFMKSQTCSYCGRIGNIFVLDQQQKCNLSPQGNDVYEGIHLNLYCHNPEQGDFYVLITQDHIIPKKFGGTKHIYNSQVLCSVCNQIKGDKITHKDIQLLISTKKRKRYLIKHYIKNGLDFIQHIR